VTRPERIDAGTVDQALASAGSPWVREGDCLTLTRRFGSFAEAIAFVNDVAALADAANHHPDIEVHYDTVSLSVSTHDAGGLTALDLDLAAAIAAR